MAKIKSEQTEMQVEDGDKITEACEKMGVPFACYVGVCGECRIKILEGMENLSDKTDVEKQWSLAENERLACQCKIKKGEIKIDW